MSKYPLLSSSLQVGPLTLRNRFCKAPQSTRFCTPDNYITDEIIGVYEEIAAGGAALISLGACTVTPQHPATRFIGTYDDKFIPGLARLAEAVHKHDAYLVAQIYHGGPNDPLGYDMHPVASSTIAKEDLPTPLFHPTRGLTHDEVIDYRQRFINAAIRAHKAGWDGVEVHGGHSYFLDSFLSRVWNKRDDEYGPQSIENRTRLMREIIEGVRDACGPDFLIGCRMNGEEFMHPDGITQDESAEIAQWLEKAGVQYVSITGYGYGKVPFQYVPDYFPYPEPDEGMKARMADYNGLGLLVPGAANIKKHVSIPVIAAGRLDEDKGERLLAEGKADLINFGRQLWADHEFPNKVMEGRSDDVMRCNRCATCEEPQDDPRHCRVNPALGRERELAITPAENKKKVLVVGSGLAGMEAARVAYLRGHDVEVVDAHSRLGGKLDLAVMVKGTESDQAYRLRDQMERQMKKLGIPVASGKTIDAAFIESRKPDAVVIATGGVYPMPDIPGIDNSIVTGVKQLSKMAEVPLKMLGSDAVSKLSKIALPGVGKNVVVLGGQIEGLQGAAFLKKRGKNVTVLEEGGSLGTGIPSRYRNRLIPWLEANDVSIQTGVTYKEITKKGISYVDAEGNEQFLKADTVMVLISQVPDDTLYEQVKGLGCEVYRVGSANGAASGLMVDAMREGREVGCKL